MNCGPRHRYMVWTSAGPVIAHNCVQAACRDLLAGALLRLEASGYPVVLHVHDEVVVELEDPAHLTDVERLVAHPPEWAAGFPINVEGAVGRRYWK